MFCIVQPDTTDFRELENFTPDKEVRFAVMCAFFSGFCNNYSAKKLKLCRVLQTLCWAFERCSRVLLYLRRKWTDLDEICGTPSILFGAVPDKFWARSAQKRQREREPQFCFFCPLNNARFHRLLVGQISRNLHRKTCFRVEIKHCNTLQFLKIILFHFRRGSMLK